MNRRATFIVTITLLAWCFGLPDILSGTPAHGLPPRDARPETRDSTPSTRPATAADIAAAVRDLGHADYATREQASEFLWAVGRPAEAAVREALKSGDPEVVMRAQELMDKFDWGIYPDTPQDVVEAVNRFKSGNEDERRASVQILSGLGTPGLRALLHVYARETDPPLQRRIVAQIGPRASALTSELLLRGDRAQAESLLELGAAAGEEHWVRTYAAYLRHTGGLNGKIKQLQAQADAPAETQTLLAYLHRANGDLDGALAAAKKTGDDALIHALLYERGDWTALAATIPADAADIQSLGYRAAYARLAGKEEDFAKAVTAIQSFAQVANDADGAWPAAKALLLNDRSHEAIDILVKGGRYASAVHLLCAQHRYAEALKVADTARAAASDAVFNVDMDLAVALHFLGEDARAARLLEAYEKEPGRPEELRALFRLIRAEYRAERNDQAFALCQFALKTQKPDERPAQVFDALFGSRAEEAALWWPFLRRQFVKETESASFIRLRDLMRGEAAAVEDLVKRAEEASEVAELGGERRAQWCRALAAAQESIGDHAAAAELLEKAIDAFPSVPAMLALGDVRADLKQWEKAAAAYGRALKVQEQAPNGMGDAAPRYLHGWALTQAGHADEGRKEIEAATIQTLGDEARTYALAQALAEHGLDKEAAEFRRAILLTGAFDSWQMGETLRHEALYMERHGGDPARAALYHERARLQCLRPNIMLLDDEGYLHLSQWANAGAAKAALAAGQPERAADRVGAVLDALPDSLDTVIAAAPALEKLGRKDLADKLIQRTFDFHLALVRDFPKAASEENALAWLGARTGRRLDDALAHAQRAVALAPKNAGLLDTLAEVCFQRGDQAQAISHMKKCMELAPGRAYFRKQLDRFQKGDKTIPPPDETEP